MTEQEMMHAKKQYGKIGVADGFDDPNFISRMKVGEKEIQHNYKKEYSVASPDRETVLHRDEVKSAFHWKKMNDSNLYFLNKWDLTVKPHGTDKEYKRTFYINDLKRMGHVIKNPNQSVTTFTFKSSVNYLCGRPVLNTYSNQNGKQFKAWDQLYPDVILPNGKMKERTFHENYGFDLQKVASNYNSMKDLANAEYANRLYQSLERGNLQLETFIGKDGREESYFITPNIQVGCLDLFTTDKKRVSLEMQVEKGYITHEFAQKVQDRLNHIEQEKSTLKQERKTSENSTQKENNLSQSKNQGTEIPKKEESTTKQKNLPSTNLKKKEGQSQSAKKRQSLK